MAEFPKDSAAAFKGRHFDAAIIVLCVRWYLTYKLSYRDLQEMMAERGVNLAHTTILRWVQRYVPEFEKRWRVYARPAGASWRVDETYIKVKGTWTYLYRAGAPRNAVLNPPRSGEKFGGTLLGHPPYLNAKAGGDKSMAEKRGTPEGAYGVVLQGPRDTVKARLPEPQPPVAQVHAHGYSA